MERPELRGTFASGAADYARLRPAYPPSALDLLDGGGPASTRTLDVVDIGAGTGKLTGQLAGRGHRVVAVEPSAAMREQLATVPGVTVVAAPGEETTLPEECADLVTYGQAWHWVDAARAGQEAARLLRPGGTLALLWNMVDNAVPWVARWEEAAHSTLRAWRPVEHGRVESRPPGGELADEQVELVRWVDRVSVEALEHQARTRSYYLEGSAQEQQQIRATVAEVVGREFPGAAPQDVVELPYVTTVVRYRRA